MECHPKLEMLVVYKHSSLLDPFLRYEENEVLWIWPPLATYDIIKQLYFRALRVAIIIKINNIETELVVC